MCVIHKNRTLKLVFVNGVIHANLTLKTVFVNVRNSCKPDPENSFCKCASFM